MDPIHKMLATWHTHTFAMHRGDEGYLGRLLLTPIILFALWIRP